MPRNIYVKAITHNITEDIILHAEANFKKCNMLSREERKKEQSFRNHQQTKSLDFGII